MSDACDEAESDEEDAGSSLVAPFPKLSIHVFRAPPFDRTILGEKRDTWGCAGRVRSESDTTGSSVYSVRATRRRRVAQKRESRWLAFSMLLQPRLGEQSLWKLPEDVTRSILEKTEKRQK